MGATSYAFFPAAFVALLPQEGAAPAERLVTFVCLEYEPYA